MVVMQGNELARRMIPSAVKSAQIINFSMRDLRGRIWVGTNGGGLWRIDDGRMINVSARYHIPDTKFFCAAVGRDSSTYFGTAQHVYHFKGGSMTLIPEISGFIKALNAEKADTLLVGTSKGAFMYTANRFFPYPSNLPQMVNISVASIAVAGKRVFLGTAGNGLFVDPNGNGTRLSNVSVSKGLSSNNIYSMVMDRSGHLWLATGYYINRLSFRSDSIVNQVKLYGKSEGINSAEGNQNSAFLDQDGSIWIGTSKGAYHIYPQHDKSVSEPIPVFLTNVLLFSQPVQTKAYYDSMTGYYPVPAGLKLPYDQNHITFEFHGLSFSAPEAVRYQYYVEAMESGFSAPSAASSVVYSAMPPGKYVFRVRALSEDNAAPGNVASFPFEITAPYYATPFFRLVVVVFLILTGVFIQWWRNRVRVQKQLMIEKLRKNEQYIVRKKTAEDFHDEMGNKLTRISILTDIASSKLQHDKEALKLISQIRDNAMTLYNGTRDIIWSLYPESDQLIEILLRMREFGIDLFGETEIEFVFSYPEEMSRSVKLPMGYSRNIMMICKETLNNILKHADCTEVTMEVSLNLDCYLHIGISDNGKGFKMNNIRHGHGIDNMHIRAKRIHAVLSIEGRENQGTKMTLDLKIPL
jgi:signal transduction histidine kinase